MRQNQLRMPSLTKPRRPSIEEALGSSQVAEILGVHPRTVQRRRAARAKLRPLEAQREEKLCLIWRELLELFSTDNAVRWLTTPLPVLQDRRPLEVMAEEGGLDRVRDVIGSHELGHLVLMVDLPAFFGSAPEERFAGAVYRICAARRLPSLLSMMTRSTRGSDSSPSASIRSEATRQFSAHSWSSVRSCAVIVLPEPRP